MAVYENQLTRFDDFIVFTTRLPFTGVVRVDTFTDIVSGEDVNTYFQREISYSIDGLFFTPWLPLNNDTLQAINCPKGNLWVNYKYTRKGVNNNTPLEFSQVELVGDFEQSLPQNLYALPKSIFRDLFANNPQHLSMCAHLTKKLFDPGIVAAYVTRNEGEDPAKEDEDYLAFWGAVSCFYALIILFGKQFEDIENHPVLLKEYLAQKDLIFGPSASATQLNHLRRNQYAVVRLRGTAGAIAAPTPGQIVVSELASLLDNDNSRDEFLIASSPTGLTVGRTSPLYRGTTGNYGLNKAYEQTIDVVDIDKYPLINPTYITLEQVQALGNSYGSICIRDIPGGEASGIQQTSSSPNYWNIDKYTDYEVSFFVIRKDSDAANLKFGVNAYDVNGDPVTMFKAGSSKEPTNTFSADLTLPNPNATYLVRGIIYGSMTQASQQLLKLSVDPNGVNLLMTEQVAKITPVIILDNLGNPSVAGEVFIWNLQLRPLKTGYSLGFIQSGSVAQAWLKNRNNNLTAYQLEQVIRHKLLPYNVGLRITNLYDSYRPEYIQKFRVTPKVTNCTTIYNNDGLIELEVIGGVPPYRYRWAYGQFGDSLRELVPGTYSVVITDNQTPAKVVSLVRLQVLPYVRPTGWRVRASTAYCEATVVSPTIPIPTQTDPNSAQ